MPNFRYHSKSFPRNFPQAFKGINTLNVTWSEIIHSAYTVGRQSIVDVLMHGKHSIYEIIYRSAIIYANLKEDSSGHLQKSDAYKGLDFSEKSAISYFLGLAFSKLLANRLLGITGLMHLDVYKSILNPRILKGRSRPDLVGQDTTGRWIVMESKGRTSKLPSGLMAKAKRQTRRVRSIGGSRNILRVALAVCFDKNILNVHWADPEKAIEKSVDIPINKVEFIANYYEPFRQLFTINAFDEDSLSYSKNEFRLIKLPASDTSIGINTEINSMLKKRNYEGIYEYLKEKPGIQIQDGPGNTFIGNDGIMIVTGRSWETSEMRKEPQERRNNS